MRTRSLMISGLLACVLALGPALVFEWAGGPEGGILPSFSSPSHLASFLHSRQTAVWGGMREGDVSLGAATGGPSAPGFSRTNVQVEGIDEADLVKTDGEFLFISSYTRVTVVRAYPPGALANVSYIDIGAALGTVDGEYASISGLFLAPGKLIVLASLQGTAIRTVATSILPVEWEPPELRTVVAVFDLVDIERPALVRSYAISGYPLTFRMVDRRVLVLAQTYIYRTGEGYQLPEVCSGTTCEPLNSADIHYDQEVEYPNMFLNILSVDVEAGSFDQTSILGGYSSTVYMSPAALYVTYQKYEAMVASTRVATETISGPVTTIYKLSVDGLEVVARARADVPGALLNQFSMDEFQGLLRVATTTGSTETTNSVYVLDGDMRMVGAVEGLAPGERIFSVRFLGNMAYVVTFRRVDPLFVIDLSDPSRPRVTGFLKVPGFSQYLHPLGGGRLLGVGRETTEVPESDWAMIQGLKVSLFDVSDPADPREVDHKVFGGRGSYSEVLHDHKAFLQVPSHSLVVLPVHLVLGEGPSDWTSWQGVYVLSVATEGLSLRGGITHGGSDQPYYGVPDRTIQRAVYIGDYLYTISPTVVKAHALGDLREVASLLYSTGYPAWEKPTMVQG